MYRPLTLDKVIEIRKTYIALLNLRENIRSEEALRMLVASECGVTPFDVDRVLDEGMTTDPKFKSTGIFHTWPAHKVRRIL